MSNQAESAAARAPKRERGKQRVAALLAAAASVFAEKGYEAATMTEIAARAAADSGDGTRLRDRAAAANEKRGRHRRRERPGRTVGRIAGVARFDGAVSGTATRQIVGAADDAAAACYDRL